MNIVPERMPGLRSFLNSEAIGPAPLSTGVGRPKLGLGSGVEDRVGTSSQMKG